jgi:hypothetical protein
LAFHTPKLMHPRDHCAGRKFPHPYPDDFVCALKLFSSSLIPPPCSNQTIVYPYNHCVVKFYTPIIVKPCSRPMDPSRRPSRLYQFQVHGERTMRMVVDSGESTEGERHRECEQDREREQYSRPHSPTPPYRYRDPIPISLEEENEHLTNQLHVLEFKKEQLLQKMLFLQEQMESKLSSSSTLPV